MDRLVMTLKPSPLTTRLLVTLGDDEVLKAILPPPDKVHRRAASTLCEGLSLWFQRSVSVVLCADVEGNSSALGLCDGLGIGDKTVHFEVVLVEPGAHRPRSRRIGGLGSFEDLRQMGLRGVR